MAAVILYGLNHIIENIEVKEATGEQPFRLNLSSILENYKSTKHNTYPKITYTTETNMLLIEFQRQRYDGIYYQSNMQTTTAAENIKMINIYDPNDIQMISLNYILQNLDKTFVFYTITSGSSFDDVVLRNFPNTTNYLDVPGHSNILRRKQKKFDELNLRIIYSRNPYGLSCIAYSEVDRVIRLKSIDGHAEPRLKLFSYLLNYIQKNKYVFYNDTIISRNAAIKFNHSQDGWSWTVENIMLPFKDDPMTLEYFVKYFNQPGYPTITATQHLRGQNSIKYTITHYPDASSARDHTYDSSIYIDEDPITVMVIPDSQDNQLEDNLFITSLASIIKHIEDYKVIDDTRDSRVLGGAQRNGLRKGSLDTLKVVELKERAAKRGIKVSGLNKMQIIAKLRGNR